MAERAAARREWSLHRFEPGDEREIVDLFNRVFGQHRTLEHWNWKFKDNPYGGPFATLARSRSTAELVGTYIVIPFPLNVKGERRLGCQTVDLVTRPDFQRQGIFRTTAIDGYRQYRSAGIDLVIAFPNPDGDSYHGFTHTLGWHRILSPHDFVLRLGLERKLGRRLAVPLLPRLLDRAYRWSRRVTAVASGRSPERLLGGKVELDIAERVPDGYDELWMTVRCREVLSLWKDARYLRWRYQEHPDHRFDFLSLSMAGELLGVAVALRRDGIVTLCEFVTRDRDVLRGQALANAIASHYLAGDVEEIRFFGFDGGYFKDALVGFSETVANRIQLVGKVLEAESLSTLVPDAASWTITFGDADFV